MKSLFVAGCQRSGATAFIRYLNLHPRVLVCRERYKYIPRQVTSGHFSFERILDYSEEETNVPEEQFVELLADKEPKELKWIGDKNPDYYKHFDGLLRRNPGGRFIILYRPLEEVAESFEARAKDPEDHWPARYDYEMSVKLWNLALNRTREFIESGEGHRVLILDYHAFFDMDRDTITLLSRFLEIEFDEAILDSWRELGTGFENSRRSNETLDEQQRTFVLENKDRAAEEWILERIAHQLSEPDRVFSEQPESRELPETQRLREQNRRLRQRIKKLETRINELESSPYRRLLKKIVKLKRALANRRLKA
ncbi:hypothetical protein BH23ACT11_BH23ACT11_13950 [soil metagenome]